MTYQQGGIAGILEVSREVLVLLLGIILVVGVALGMVAFSIFGGGSGDSVRSAGQRSGAQSAGSDSGQIGPCTVAPEIDVTSVGVEQSGFEVTANLSTSCADGDVLSGPSVDVVGTGGGRQFVSAVFNMQSNPIVIPPGEQVERTFVFPPRAYWRPADVLGNDTLQVQMRGYQQSTTTGSAPTSGTLTGVSQGSPLESDAEAALRDIAARDYPYVQSNLADRWVPQIGSKKLGIVAEGKVFTNAEMLFDHLAYRARYDDVRLVWSAQWTTFSAPDFWVTVVGDTFADAGPANGWCDSHGIDAFNCFAKMISDHRGPSGTMVMRH